MPKTSPLITKRKVQIVLGLLWILDGALQLQRQMFSSAFANKVIEPVAQGQPLIVSGPINFGIRVFLTHPALFNSLIAVVQLVIGFLILWKRSIRVGLSASVGWALVVWYLGEGLGSLLSSHTLIIMGAPGAAIIYAILSLAVMPSSKGEHQDEYARPAYWLPLVWAIIWIGGAIYQVLPGQNRARELSSMISANAVGAPGWLASLDTHAAHLLSRSNFWVISLLIIFQILIGLSIFSPGILRKISVIAGCAASLVFWVFGQNLGSYYSGLATDPGSAPLFILLGIAILGCLKLDFKKLFIDSGHRLEQFLT